MIDTLKTWLTQNRKEIVRFLKFAVVGTFGAVVDFSILYLMHRVIGLPIIPANTISFTCAVISNFVWNRYWTYPDSRSKPLGPQFGQFLVVNIAGWAINTTILALLESPLTGVAGGFFTALNPEQVYNIGYNAAKAVATGVVMFWNFFVNRFWTYNDVD